VSKYGDDSYESYRCSTCNKLMRKAVCINCEVMETPHMTINELEDKVREFQVKKGFPDHIKLDDTAYLMFRNALLLEEVSELFMAIHRKDEIEIADGLADVIYIVIGTCGILNIPIGPVLEEVHRSNMTKDKGAVKGKNYERPDIKKVLEGNS